MATDTIRSGAPKNQSTIVSRYVDTEYFQRQCDLYFPKDGNFTYGSKAGRTAEDVNAVTEGWNLTDTTRLLWANGLVSRSPLLTLLSRRAITVAPLYIVVQKVESQRERQSMLTSSASTTLGARPQYQASSAPVARWLADRRRLSSSFPARGTATTWHGGMATLTRTSGRRRRRRQPRLLRGLTSSLLRKRRSRPASEREGWLLEFRGL
jgi:hypothetical protein